MSGCSPRPFIAVATLALSLVPSLAFADFAGERETVINAPNAPVIAVRCTTRDDWNQQSSISSIARDTSCSAKQSRCATPTRRYRPLPTGRSAHRCTSSSSTPGTIPSTA
jgi:hypothetical protein